MIIHHIKPEQFAQLETLFAKETKSGLEIPSWLQRLRQTAIGPATEKDFEPTIPLAGTEHDPEP